jgi:hypothetical protein
MLCFYVSARNQFELFLTPTFPSLAALPFAQSGSVYVRLIASQQPFYFQYHPHSFKRVRISLKINDKRIPLSPFSSINYALLRHSSPGSHLFCVCSPKHTGGVPPVFRSTSKTQFLKGLADHQNGLARYQTARHKLILCRSRAYTAVGCRDSRPRLSARRAPG